VSSDYFLEIESHFTQKRGTPFVVNAKDWVLMKKWQEEGVPLPVVIEAIDSVFEKAEERKKVVNSLSYCKHAVKELWAERRALHVGDHDVAPEEGAEPLLAALAADLATSSAPPAVLATMTERITALAKERSVPAIEEQLIDLERELIEAVFAAVPAAEAEAIRAAVARALGDTSRLDEKTRGRTEEANLRRIVRERFGLPRLTLFR
jgi:hypothetical protein